MSTLYQIAAPDQDHLDPRGQDGSLFTTMDVEQVALRIKRDGLALGLRLPDDLRDALAEFGTTTPVKPWGAREGLPLEAVAGGRLPTGEPVAVAETVDLDRCEAVRRITHDPKLLLLGKRVLGFNPQGIEASLRWSFPTNLPPTQHKDIDLASRWHYDVIGKNSVSLFFYILKGDDDLDGAHATILGSHRRKKVSMLFRPSTTISEAELMSYYGPGQVVIATGEPGDGFAEDPNTFHRAMQPISSARLVLLIRYT
ncbi:hypothetical protein JL101_030695 (plasmid) [Skermanella rosea]|uniref:hypothetical protein n=1 Tax=Skermanella rosea TaxID=1817965 RepID=UPI001933FFBC|nr:hypothetical protein [Skermanella rosea]UEM06858.1 hypothetical protein JL101_030695 [Skermanella rosea]